MMDNRADRQDLMSKCLQPSAASSQRLGVRLPTDHRGVLRAEPQSLTTINEELESLLDGLDLPMVIVDAERCVRRFTSSARRMVNVIASDIGRPIDDIRWNVNVDDVDAMVRRAAEGGTMEQRRWFAARVSQCSGIRARILAMRERVGQLGRACDINFTSYGTTVHVRVPLHECNR